MEKREEPIRCQLVDPQQTGTEKLNLYIHHTKNCDSCGKSVVDTHAVSSKSLGCAHCRKRFFICGHCGQEKCPVCAQVLTNDKSIFPYNAFEAVSNGDEEALAAILADAPCHVDDIRNEQETSLLEAAAVKQHAGICKMLVDRHGASVFLTGKSGRTILMEMVRARHSGKWDTQISGHFTRTINDVDADGKTALMFAAAGAGLSGSKKGNMKIALDLIGMGADLSIADRRGVTALGWAMASNRKSPTSNNEIMVNFLKREMIAQAAHAEFRRNFDYEISEKGTLDYSPRLR